MQSSWSLLPAGLELVLAEVARGRQRIVECGSGESTVAIGRELAARGEGRLYALEHDPHWHAETRASLSAAGAAERVELLLAPLRDGWYERTVMERLPHGIDLLLVDGPPGELSANGETRFPALPALAARLAPDAVVILDDIHRPGEQRILERWERDHPIRFERCPEERLAMGVFSVASGAKTA